MRSELNPESHFVFAPPTDQGQDEKNDQDTQPDHTEDLSADQVHPLLVDHPTGEQDIYTNSPDPLNTGGF